MDTEKRSVGSWCRQGHLGLSARHHRPVRVARENVPLSFGCVNLGAKDSKVLGCCHELFFAFVEREYRPYRIWGWGSRKME